MYTIYTKIIHIIHRIDTQIAKTHYNLEIPTEPYNKLKNIAKQEKTTIAELLRRATKLLLFVQIIGQDPNAHLLVERGGEIQQIVVDLI